MRVGHLAEDAFDVGPEPDVEHPVGLVEDDVEDFAQVERPPLDVVEHAAGRADDDVDAAFQGPELLLDRLAAVDAADRRRPGRGPAFASRRRSAGRVLASARG